MIIIVLMYIALLASIFLVVFGALYEAKNNNLNSDVTIGRGF